MSAWEDMIEEASAELDRVEDQLQTASNHLLELQAKNQQLTLDISDAQATRHKVVSIWT